MSKHIPSEAEIDDAIIEKLGPKNTLATEAVRASTYVLRVLEDSGMDVTGLCVTAKMKKDLGGITLILTEGDEERLSIDIPVEILPSAL